MSSTSGRIDCPLLHTLTLCKRLQNERETKAMVKTRLAQVEGHKELAAQMHPTNTSVKPAGCLRAVTPERLDAE
jgi:hypothetical protein